ncbi:MAG: exodeoxyribonuclease VII large subunit [Phycisphaerales bacterium]|nr:exodeoxyribonuclease VII large subunit [Phycisphaerales bacterium]
MDISIPPRIIHTVSGLNREVSTLLESQYPSLWVEGEVSNLSRPTSGHLYFSLKDAKAQIRCALFQHRALLFRDCPRNGQQVLLRGRISLYAPRGDFQIIVDYVEEAGAGALRRAFDQLRLRLEQEGLFAPEHKKIPPRFPQRIGVITSPTGAALRDVLSVLRRRLPTLPVLVYPIPVQGQDAATQITRTLHLASQRQECDVLLLVRGGGSLEDLQAFNEESVARAIANCTIPLITGIGHETDVTIADFAADLRAPTPTAAAELASPDRQEWLRTIRLLADRLERVLWHRLNERHQRLNPLLERLARRQPRRGLQDRTQRLDELDQRLQRTLSRRLEHEQQRLIGLNTRLWARIPAARLPAAHQQLQTLTRRLRTALVRHLQVADQRLHSLSDALHTLSPLATLKRGYAILRREPDQIVIRRADQLQIGDTVEALLGSGRLYCAITAIEDQPQVADSETCSEENP